MTSSQQRALSLLHRIAANLSPRARDQFVAAVDRLQASGNEAAAARALESGDVDAAMQALLPQRASAAFAHELKVAIARVVADVGPQAAREVASIIRVKFDFVPGSPAAASAMETLILSRVVPVTQDAEAGLRAVLADGLRAGQNPRVVARAAKQFVGLTAYDQQLIASFADQLRNDPAAALDRELRDARFDATVRKAVNGAPLTDAQIARMTSEYTDNLHDWRAETWARTTTLQTTRSTQSAAWDQAADDLGIDQSRLVKTWITTLDGRERPEHHAMHGQTVPIDQPYSNGDMIPGDGQGGDPEYGCRCGQTVRLLPASQTAAGQFLNDREAAFAKARDQLGNTTGARGPTRREIRAA